MALTIGAGGATALYGGSNGTTYTGQQFLRRPILLPPPQPTSRYASLITRASKKWSPRTGKLDGRTRRSSSTTTKEEEEEEERRTVQIGTEGGVDATGADDGYFLPELPGLEKDFWEGPEWDGFGFFAQYMWAFGIGFALCQQLVELRELEGASVPVHHHSGILWAVFWEVELIASGFAVATYNEGATDFKQTPAYKESIQSRDLLEEPEGSSSDVFESNPTEEAPSLE
ncbi:hypothetical protein RHSIM_Rhsim13G0208500 [Rhododendron simsii]|uniref:Uncharacterized protein n=1 Tax=Rhododendron simsii TaxID=118357 RepID=A0A834FZM7_RHOSS|nr:hypothetical protein RHSIM_Rhsim13G0208500 [Rhododendron simsii]